MAAPCASMSPSRVRVKSVVKAASVVVVVVAAFVVTVAASAAVIAANVLRAVRRVGKQEVAGGLLKEVRIESRGHGEITVPLLLRKHEITH